jgi:hypothetical protein
MDPSSLRCAFDDYHYCPLVDLASLYERREIKTIETAWREKVHMFEQSPIFSLVEEADIIGPGEKGSSTQLWCSNLVK